MKLPAFCLPALLCLLALPCLLTARPAPAAPPREYRLGIILPGGAGAGPALRDAVMTHLNSRHMQHVIDWRGRGVMADDAQFVHAPGDAPERLDRAAAGLMRRDDIDLVISCSAEATQALARHANGRTHIFHMAEDDPFPSDDGAPLPQAAAAGLHMSPGRDFTCDNVVYLKSMDEHGDITSIGMIYEDTPRGRRAARLEEMTRGCSLAGIALLAEPMPDAGPRACRQAIDRLADRQPSLVYLNPRACFNGPGLEDTLEPLTRRGIPAYGDSDPGQAARGAMLAITQTAQARQWLAAYGIAAVLSGRQDAPPSLHVENDITLNIAVAAATGFVPGYTLLAAADSTLWKVLDEHAEREAHDEVGPGAASGEDGGPQPADSAP